MKKAKILFTCLFLGLLFCSCNKEPDYPERMRVEGKFITFPMNNEFITCSQYSSHLNLNIPIQSKVSGYFDLLGVIDVNTSTLVLQDCDLDIDKRELTTSLQITIMNIEGDGIQMVGTSKTDLDGITKSNFQIVKGYGNCLGKSGWFKSIGTLDVNTGVKEFSGEGSITLQPSPQ